MVHIIGTRISALGTDGNFGGAAAISIAKGNGTASFQQRHGVWISAADVVDIIGEGFSKDEFEQNELIVEL